jgi:DNA invertase Pin-like site-specific DNA recombinase
VTIAICLRVSSTTQDTRSQEPDLTTWAKSQSEEAIWYRDKATGTVMSRPGLDKLLADARAGKITKVVVWRLDRLGLPLSSWTDWPSESSSG